MTFRIIGPVYPSAEVAYRPHPPTAIPTQPNENTQRRGSRPSTAPKQPLDSVHHACLRTATGAFRTSRRASLLVDAGEVPLDLRRMRLALLYACKIKQNPDHLTYDWIFDQSLVQRFSTTRQSSSRPLCSRIHSWFESAGISLDTLATRRVNRVEPWRMNGFCCDLSFLQHSKPSTLAKELKQLALERLGVLRRAPSFLHRWVEGCRER